MPFFAWISFMVISYSFDPEDMVSSCMVSISCLFFIMVWMTIKYMELVNPISEQLLLLKVRNDDCYYLSKIVFLLLLGTIMSVIGVLFPTMKNAIIGFRLYTRPLTACDVGASFVLHFFMALLGIVTGSLLQPRTMKERKTAVLLTAGIAIMGLAKEGLNAEMPAAKFVTWIFPPLNNVVACFANKDFYYLQDIARAIIYVGIYSAILLILNVQLLKKKKF